MATIRLAKPSICYCGQGLEQLDVPPCQNEWWGGHGNLEVASHQILCPYQLLKISDVVLGHLFSNKNLASSRLWTSSWIRHILDIIGHIVGTRGLVKMCSLLVPMTHLTRSFAQNQNLCLAICGLGLYESLSLLPM